jgi:uncharacterized repeat protein (TIGR03803 family)
MGNAFLLNTATCLNRALATVSRGTSIRWVRTKLSSNTIALVAGLVFCVLSGTNGFSSTIIFTNLLTFDGTNGSWPLCTLVQAPDGSLFGTTSRGGARDAGTVFRMSTDGTFLQSASFNTTNGALPRAGVVIGSDGAVYGTTRQGGVPFGYGNVFRMTPDGTISNLHVILNPTVEGIFPEAALMEGNDGAFYGTTYQGAIPSSGTVFRITTNGIITNLVVFTGNSGSYPGYYSLASLITASDGNFYGTTSSGNAGTIFRLTPSGSFTNLATFNSPTTPNSGRILRSQLVEGNDRRLYGTAQSSGTPEGFGTVFAMTTNGQVTALVRFAGTNGAYPYGGLVLGKDGNFYGMTSQGGEGGWKQPGTVFQMTPGGVIKTLITFTGTNGAYLGSGPQASLVLGQDGNFYGTTKTGGALNLGTVFRITVLTPAIHTLARTNTSLCLSWSSVAGYSYQLQSEHDLSSTNWINEGSPILATNGNTTTSVAIGAEDLKCFRVMVIP